MDSKQFEDDDGKMWTATIPPGLGKPGYGRDSKNLNTLVFRDIGVKAIDVDVKESSIKDFSIEKLKKLLKEAQ